MLMQKHAAVRGEDRALSSEATVAAADLFSLHDAPAEPRIGVAVIGADDRIEYCNAQYPKLWGLPPGALADRAAGTDSERARARMNGILFRHDAIRTRNVVRYGDGRRLELVSVSVRDPFGPGLRRIMFVRELPEPPAPPARRSCLARVLARLVNAI